MKLLSLLIIFALNSAFAASVKRTSVSWQLGPESSSYNLDIGIAKSSTLGIHFQQQFAENKTSNSTYMLNGFSNYGLNYEHFLGPDKKRFLSGVVLSAGIHLSKLSESSIHQEIILNSKETFRPGDSKLGGRFAASYRFYSNSLFAGAGIEANKTGKALIFLPLKVQLGLLF